MITSGYVTGRAGMGHVAITSTDPAGIHRYFGTVFDSRLSDFIDENIAGLTPQNQVPARQRASPLIAVAGTRGVRLDPIRTSVQHVNIQVADLEDMLAAYHRVQELGFRMAWSVGQHTNDRELSFYCVTPRVSNLRWAGIRSLSHPSSKRPGPSAHTRESAFGATMTSAFGPSTASASYDRPCCTRAPLRSPSRNSVPVPQEDSYHDRLRHCHRRPGTDGPHLAHLWVAMVLRVLVLEREPEFYGNARAVYTDDEALRVFQTAGVADEIHRDMNVDSAVQWITADGTVLVQFREPSRRMWWPITNFLYQPYLETTLEQLLSRYQNVTVRRSREVTGFTDTGTHVAVDHAPTGGGLRHCSRTCRYNQDRTGHGVVPHRSRRRPQCRADCARDRYDRKELPRTMAGGRLEGETRSRCVQTPPLFRLRM